MIFLGSFLYLFGSTLIGLGLSWIGVKGDFCCFKKLSAFFCLWTIFSFCFLRKFGSTGIFFTLGKFGFEDDCFLTIGLFSSSFKFLISLIFGFELTTNFN